MHARAITAEIVGTFLVHFVLFGAWLLLAEPSPDKTVSVALATGLALMVVTTALGHISGGHFNPAITIGLIAGGRFDVAHAPGFIVAQVIGAALAATLYYALFLTSMLSVPSAALASIANGFDIGDRATLITVLIFEAVATMMLVIAFMGATASRALATLAPLVVGAAFAALYIIAIPISGGGLNPARSSAAAIFAGTEALSQLWAFWLAPTIGALAGGLLARFMLNESADG